MQDKTKPVFVIATANNIRELPAALLRKGRFDEIFFCGLPHKQEREEIFEIHIRKRGRKPEEFDLPKLAEASEGFSGSEIEQAIVEGLYEAFSEDKDIDTETVLEAVNVTVPLSRTMREDIDGLRQWAKDKARFASSHDAVAVRQDVSADHTPQKFKFRINPD